MLELQTPDPTTLDPRMDAPGPLAASMLPGADSAPSPRGNPLPLQRRVEGGDGARQALRVVGRRRRPLQRHPPARDAAAGRPARQLDREVEGGRGPPAPPLRRRLRVRPLAFREAAEDRELLRLRAPRLRGERGEKRLAPARLRQPPPHLEPEIARDRARMRQMRADL